MVPAHDQRSELREQDVAPALEMTEIRKTFGDKVAIERIDLVVERGEVHAICGENGAGKSTLMNILAGIHQPDSGRLVLNGRAVQFADVAKATDRGIGMVHQHFTLVPSMTIAENIYLGRQPRLRRYLTDKRTMLRQAQEVIDRYGFRIDASAVVRDLTVGQRQRVEIVKSLAFDAEILILDEPTAVLTPPEVDDLMEVIHRLRDRGRTVLFITHKLREVKAVSDRVTVIRRGQSVATHTTSEVTQEQIAEAMVGRSVFLTERRGTHTTGEAAMLETSGLTLRNADDLLLLDGVSLKVRPGEIVGIAGVEGNGQTELAEVITGLRRPESGTVRLDGKDLTRATPAALRAAGIAHIPEDRLDRGLSAEMSVAENLALSNYRSSGISRRGVVGSGRLDEWARHWIERFDIRGAAPQTPVGQLSGGNMQKVVVARELARRPRALVVAQPTRGVDIGASEFVHHQVLAAAEGGCAVLLFSSELSEILALSDRIGVMFRGAMVAMLDRAEATEERIGILMNTGKEVESA
jgi:simple sugar transport system ATP-binding protein